MLPCFHAHRAAVFAKNRGVGRGVEAHVALLLTLAAVFGAAWLIHRFVEMPTHRFGQRLARRIAARDAAKRA